MAGSWAGCFLRLVERKGLDVEEYSIYYDVSAVIDWFPLGLICWIWYICVFGVGNWKA